ncbi:MAG TPA: zinc-finger domain-containing protein [Gammaproteobacteria bacterium]|nr:zinc-finger domain-containing protein [Gammaproteobacteria bacterium]
MNAELARVEAKVKVRVEVKLETPTAELSCPLPSMTLWNMHPRVYLALDEDNHAMCPYCSTHYVADVELLNHE